MTGLTVAEIAERLEITPEAVRKRIERLSIKPITKEAIYPEESLEAIRNVPGKGRPKKKKD